MVQSILKIKSFLDEMKLSEYDIIIYYLQDRPVMIYVSKCWTLKKDERRLETMVMKMLRRMLSMTLKDRMRNKNMSRTTVTSSVVSVIEVNKLR